MRVYLRRDASGQVHIETEASSGSYSPDSHSLWCWIEGDEAEVEEIGGTTTA